MTARRRVHPLIDELAEQRRALDFTRPQAAELAGISRSALCALEAGKWAPRLDVLEGLAHALGYRVALIRIDEKQCRTCGQVKPLRRFARDTRTTDGFANHCGPCRAAGAEDVTSDEPARRVHALNISDLDRERGRLAALKIHAAARDERIARYAELRRGGLTVAAAAERLGVTKRTGERYEAIRKENQETAA